MLKTFKIGALFDIHSTNANSATTTASATGVQREFKNYRITDYFVVRNTHSIPKEEVRFGGSRPYVTAGSSGNSVAGYIDYDESLLEEGNSIMIGGRRRLSRTSHTTISPTTAIISPFFPRTALEEPNSPSSSLPPRCRKALERSIRGATRCHTGRYRKMSYRFQQLPTENLISLIWRSALPSLSRSALPSLMPTSSLLVLMTTS